MAANTSGFEGASKIKNSPSSMIFYIIAYIVVAFMAIVCLVPFLIMVSGSFTAEKYITFHGFNIYPVECSTSAYQIIFKNPATVAKAYGVSIYVTLLGTFLGLMITAATSYVLGRKDFKYRNKFSFFFYFTTLFNGGLVCTYIFFVRYLHLSNSLWAIILPGMFSVFNMLIMRTFVVGIPTALIESAKIDGAGEYRIFFSIILPLLKPGLATIGLFLALAYWNNWYNAMLFITDTDKFPLQYMLYNTLQKAEAMSRIAAQAGIVVADVPSNSLKMAMAVVATGPILIVYPFVQKYFVAGITIGSVKG